jgi:hypothetical protein
MLLGLLVTGGEDVSRKYSYRRSQSRGKLPAWGKLPASEQDLGLVRGPF